MQLTGITLRHFSEKVSALLCLDCKDGLGKAPDAVKVSAYGVYRKVDTSEFIPVFVPKGLYLILLRIGR